MSQTNCKNLFEPTFTDDQVRPKLQIGANPLLLLILSNHLASKGTTIVQM